MGVGRFREHLGSRPDKLRARRRRARISGYARWQLEHRDPPTSTMTMESTAAKTGGE